MLLLWINLHIKFGLNTHLWICKFSKSWHIHYLHLLQAFLKNKINALNQKPLSHISISNIYFILKHLLHQTFLVDASDIYLNSKFPNRFLSFYFTSYIKLKLNFWFSSILYIRKKINYSSVETYPLPFKKIFCWCEDVLF